VSTIELREAHHLTTSGRTEYLTPRFIIDALGPFDLDPCASAVRPWPTAARHIALPQDGLAEPWDGYVWLNPPFGRAPNGTTEADWVRKLAMHGPGGILLSSPNKTETAMWQSIIFQHCDGILFLTPRLKFCNVDGSSMAGTFGPSCLVAFGDEMMERLRTAVQRGRLGGYCATVESGEGYRP
jgi:hypothetical protein